MDIKESSLFEENFFKWESISLKRFSLVRSLAKQVCFQTTLFDIIISINNILQEQKNILQIR